VDGSGDMEKGNVYYNPETWGLAPIDELELASGYEFDTYVVWVDQSGVVYWAWDTGCSCPVPFEDYKDFGDLHAVRDHGDLEELKRELGRRVMDGHALDRLMGFFDSVKDAWGYWVRSQRTKLP